MASPIKKYFGSLSLDNLKKAIASVPSKVKESEKYGKEFQINAAMWDDGNISFDVYNKDTQESFKLGSIRISNFDDATQDAAPAAADSDLPF